MKKFVAMYCISDPDNYVGHRIKDIQAESFEDAEKQMYSFLDGLFYKGKIEYRIDEVVVRGSYRVYDTEKCERL